MPVGCGDGHRFGNIVGAQNRAIRSREHNFFGHGTLVKRSVRGVLFRAPRNTDHGTDRCVGCGKDKATIFNLLSGLNIHLELTKASCERVQLQWRDLGGELNSQHKFNVKPTIQRTLSPRRLFNLLRGKV